MSLPNPIEPATPATETEGIQYAGSKRKMLPEILKLVERTGCSSVFDGFAGSTRVSQALANAGYRVHANDISEWSYPFAMCYLCSPYPSTRFQPLIDELNALPPIDGWFTKHYGGLPNEEKKPWQIHNTRKLDAIREAIDTMQLDELHRAVALSSLMLALDDVDSTLGHQAAYLRDWSKRSFNALKLKVPKIKPQTVANTVTRGDVFNALPSVNCDLAYYDPPYGSNNEKMPPSRVRYAAYYHLWTTICKNDKPTLFGKAGRRADSSDRLAASAFEDFRVDETGRFRVISTIEALIKKTPCEWILLSYSSGGRATAEQLRSCIEDMGKMEITCAINHRKHIMSHMRSTGEWLKETEDKAKHQEYLFLFRKK